MKTRIAQVIKIFGIMAMVAAFAAAAFPTRSFAAEESNVGKLIVTVYSASNTQLAAVAPTTVAGATVTVLNSNGVVVTSATTDSNGSITLEVAKGTYKVQVSAKGYQSVTGTAIVNAGSATSIKFELRPTIRLNSGGK